MAYRIYAVRDGNNNVRLVDAANQAQALRHVARSQYTVAPVKPKELAELIGNGVRIEPATGEHETDAA